MPEAQPQPPLLELDDLRLRVPGASRPTVVVEHFSVRPGERVVVRGPSGSGKTSLLRCLVGLERPQRGSLRFRGFALADAAYPEFRAACTYVPQKPVAVAGTVEQELAFAREQAAQHQRADRWGQPQQRAALDALGLGALPWDRAFDRLSVGEQQRVALVRSLSLAPCLLLVDEPTSALDPEHATAVETMLLEHVAEREDERALLWVTHDPAQADRVATRSFELRPPPIAAQGSDA